MCIKQYPFEIVSIQISENICNCLIIIYSKESNSDILELASQVEEGISVYKKAHCIISKVNDF